MVCAIDPHHPMQSESPSPSPSAVRRARAVKKITSAWSAIKKFSPVRKIKSSQWTIRTRKRLADDDGRLTMSQPDISCTNIAGLAYSHKRSRDDMDLILKNTNQKRPLAYDSLDDEQPSCSYQKSTLRSVSVDNDVDIHSDALTVSLQYFSMLSYFCEHSIECIKEKI